MKSASHDLGDQPTRIEPAVGSGTLSPSQRMEFTELLGREVGNYVIDRPLAHGGMSTVLVAKHPKLGREVAVKFLRREFQEDVDLNRRFLQEAQVTATLHHPNVVEIYDFGKLEGRAYYIMELLRGADLSAHIRKRRRFPAQEVVRYLEQICAALDAAHRAGVVHRDLKPANVFVLDQPSLYLKLMDFGIAKVPDSMPTSATLHGQILGTATHMAPEQALGQIERISHKSDLYSVGVMAYQMLTGALPFSNASDVLLMAMHVRDPVPPIRERVPEVPEHVAKLVELCLAKDPQERPESAAKLAALLSADTPPSRAVPDLADGEPRQPAEATTLADPVAAEAPLGQAAAMSSEVLPAAPSLVQTTTDDPIGSVLLALGAGDDDDVHAEDPAHDERRTRKRRVELANSEAKVLDKLLRRMRRRADFPAFLNNVTEISRKADAASHYSAAQLSESILKDLALTAKLLRLVNTMFTDRFSGKVFSVHRTVVILGFDRVRSMAMGISIFKIPGQRAREGRREARPANGEFHEHLANNAVNSFISGDIARLLARKAGVKDAELAMMCAMFRNLGQQLVIEYLPEEYGQILNLAREHRLSLAAASGRVLGTSFEKVGYGIAERWCLPRAIQLSMLANPAPDDMLAREEARLGALAKLANDFCQIVVSEDRHSAEISIDRLLAQNRRLISLDPKEVTLLLSTICKSVEDHYAALLGEYARRNRFLRNARRLLGEELPPEPAAAPPLTQGETDAFHRRVHELALGLEQGRDRTALLGQALQAMAAILKVPRLMLFVVSPDRKQLLVRSAIGEDHEVLQEQLQLPVSQSDLLSLAMRSGKCVTIDDALEPRIMRRVPQRYYEVLGSGAFALYPCVERGYAGSLLLADADHKLKLPVEERVSLTLPLRQLIAKMAAGRR